MKYKEGPFGTCGNAKSSNHGRELPITYARCTDKVRLMCRDCADYVRLYKTGHKFCNSALSTNTGRYMTFDSGCSKFHSADDMPF